MNFMFFTILVAAKVMKYFILITYSLFFSFITMGQGHDADFTLTVGDKVEDLMLAYYDIGEFNGSILMIEDGKVIYENTFGYADVENKDPLDANSPFYLASLSKQFTAMAIMMLVEQGKISLNDKLTRFLPLMPSAYDPVTIDQLLTHTAGIKDYHTADIKNYFDLGIYGSGLTNNDVYKALVRQGGPEFSPGQKYRYSNSGYVLLAMIVQIASGQLYPDFMREHIFVPLSMNSTFVHTPETINNRRVKGYTRKFKPDDYKLFTNGDGGIYSTARDLIKWENAVYEGTLVSRSTLARAFTPVLLMNGRERRYGYGWEIGNNLKGKFIYHSGSLGGFRTYMEQQLGTENAMIILSNNSSSSILQIRNTLVKILDGRPYTSPDSN